MKPLVLIFFGGGLGSVARFLLGKWVTWFSPFPNFPLGTLVVNVTACFILGLIIGLADHRQFLSTDSRAFWAIGFCGGFSTFSTFSLETAQLFQQQMTAIGVLYIVGSVALCWGAVLLGVFLAR